MTLRVGIVGHRRLDSARSWFVSSECKRILKEIAQTRSPMIAVSAIAEGADTLFAEVAVTLGIPLEVVRPFDSYDSDFIDIPARNRYSKLRALAQNEVRMRYASRSTVAYESAMVWVVKTSDLLLAAWDGYPANGPGGTGSAVEEAVRLQRPWIHLNTSDFTMTRHLHAAL